MSFIPAADNSYGPVDADKQKIAVDSANKMSTTPNRMSSVNDGTKRHKIHISPVQGGSSEASNALPPLPVTESSFVTPGVFRRKLNKKRVVSTKGEDEGNDKDKEEGQTSSVNEKSKHQFSWSIDQMAVLRPVQFDESELSMPPEDWDPNEEHNCTQPSAIEQFWSRNLHIVPSPDVLLASKTAFRQRQAQGGVDVVNSSATSDPIHSVVFCSPNFPGRCPSSTTTTSLSDPSSVFSSMQTSPASPAFESTRRTVNSAESENLKPTTPTGLLDENSAEFEQIERSFSSGIDGDEILADLGEEQGGFVRRQSNENEKSGGEESGGGAVPMPMAGSGGKNSTSGFGSGESWTAAPALPPPFCIDTSPIKSTSQD